jgi:hypothetical protein
MRRLFAPAAIAAVAISIMPVMAFADDSDTQDSVDLTPPASDTYFDLGIDVSNVGNSAAAVRSFILGLEPETQRAIMGACEHFMEAPATAQNIDTITFCQNAVSS